MTFTPHYQRYQDRYGIYFKLAGTAGGSVPDAAACPIVTNGAGGASAATGGSTGSGGTAGADATAGAGGVSAGHGGSPNGSAGRSGGGAAGGNGVASGGSAGGTAEPAGPKSTGCSCNVVNTTSTGYSTIGLLLGLGLLARLVSRTLNRIGVRDADLMDMTQKVFLTAYLKLPEFEVATDPLSLEISSAQLCVAAGARCARSVLAADLLAADADIVDPHVREQGSRGKLGKANAD